MIHICYGLHDAKGLYSKYTGTSMLSIFENTSAEVTVHILHDNTLTQSNHDKFVEIAEKYGQKLEFFNVENFCEDKINLVKQKLKKYVDSRFSIGTFYRLMIDKNSFNEKVSKMIYLDSDTIVNLDIQELWNYPEENFSIAAVPENWATRGYMIKDKYIINSGQVATGDYFCAGILVLNFDKIEENFFYKGVEWLAENLQCECADQDLLNYFFSKEYFRLPEKFNSFVSLAKKFDHNFIYKKIYHYVGDTLGLNMKNAHDKLFFTYFTKTPWFNIEMLENLYEGMNRNINSEAFNFAVKVSVIVAGKQRAFAAERGFKDFTKKLFLVDSEEFMELPAEEIAPAVIDSLNEGEGNKIFFIMSNSYTQIGISLLKAGFKEGVDFIDGMLFLKNTQDSDGYFIKIVPFL